MTKEERLLRQEQRERAKAIEAAAREAGRGPLDFRIFCWCLRSWAWA